MLWLHEDWALRFYVLGYVIVAQGRIRKSLGSKPLELLGKKQQDGYGCISVQYLDASTSQIQISL